MPPIPSDPSQADPSIVALMHGVVGAEGTNGNPNSIGDQGTAAGIAQWSNQVNGVPQKLGAGQIPLNFQGDAKQYGLDPSDFSLGNQNKVLYAELASGKAQGLTPEEILSKHNSGRPDAYLSAATSTGSGPVGGYNVAAYVDRGMKAAQAYAQSQKSGAPNLAQAPTASNASAPVTPPANTNPDGSNTYGATFQAQPGDNPLVAGAKAIGNLPSSFVNLGSGLLNAVEHPIKTVEGLGSAAIGGVENLTGQNKGNPDQNQQTANAIGKAFLDRYGSLENAQRTAENDPAGFGADVLGVLSGGAGLADTVAGAGVDTADLTGDALKSAQEANAPVSTALNKGLSTVASPVVGAMKGAAALPVNLATEASGLATGAGAGAIRQGLAASSEGGDAATAFRSALSGNVSPEELVDQARDALGQIKQTRSATYQQMLSSLGGDSTTYDISPVTKAVDDGLAGLKIAKNEDGTLDFSRSKIRFNTSAQNDVNTVYNEMKSYGVKPGDRTAAGIDDLKQSFYDLDRPSSSVRSFTTSVAKATRGVLESAPGYTKAMGDYSDMSDKINDITKGLSLGDNAMVETTFNKLKNSLKANNPFRKQLVQELDQATGGTLLPKIAGHALSPILPGGIRGTIEAIGGPAALLSTGGGALLPLLGTALATSPRVVGELVNALGLGARGTGALMNVLNKFATPAVLGANAVNRVSPAQGLINPSLRTPRTIQ